MTPPFAMTLNVDSDGNVTGKITQPDALKTETGKSLKAEDGEPILIDSNEK